jgi:cobyrinic acid a,c-diamide synthase
LADCIKNQVDLDKIVSMANTASEKTERDSTQPNISSNKIASVKIGIFQDHAFGFYYPDDLLAMETAGAELIRINSLTDSRLPEVDGLFIGGGFPETQMKSLADNQSLLQNVKEAIESGLPVYAECGGLMYLSRSITWNNEKYPMANVIQGDIVMHPTPKGRGYIILEETDNHPWREHAGHNTIKAHEFHYSELTNLQQDYQFAYRVRRGTGVDGHHDGIIYKNLLANYGHLRNSQSNPWVERFIIFINHHKQLTNGSAQPMLAP